MVLTPTEYSQTIVNENPHSARATQALKTAALTLWTHRQFRSKEQTIAMVIYAMQIHTIQTFVHVDWFSLHEQLHQTTDE